MMVITMKELYNHYKDIKIKWWVVFSWYIIYLFWFFFGIVIVLFGLAPIIPIIILEIILVIAFLDTIRRLPKQVILYNDKIMLPVNNILYLIKKTNVVEYNKIQKVDSISGKIIFYLDGKKYQIYIKDNIARKHVEAILNERGV